MVECNLTIDPLVNYEAGLVAHIVIVEKTTMGNVGNNGETEFHNVMMKMLPDASGTTLGALATGVQVSLNETFDMDETFMETPNDLALNERLSSRLLSGIVTEIKTPDFETRMAILKNNLSCGTCF